MITPIIIGNWKLNGNKKFIINFIDPLNQFLEKYYKLCTVVITPPIIYLNFIQNFFINKKKKFFLGAQNIDFNISGAFTGENSPVMLKEFNVSYVIIGHSECRLYHSESNEIVAKKFLVLKKEKIIPILCIGENKKQYHNNETKEVLKNQIDIIFKICGYDAFNNSIIAYEPIWSIGSGIIPSLTKIQSIASFMRSYIQFKTNNILKNFFIQYGGSVTAKNSKDIINLKDIDGFLIGGASLKIKEFTKIIKISNS